MFLKDHRVRIQENFEKLLAAYPQALEPVCAYRERCSEDEYLALQYLYTTMPLSDMGNYPVEIFADYAAHSVRLYHEFARVRALPEDIYLNYVLYHRVNTEQIELCRSLFFEQMQSFGEKNWMAQEKETAIVQEVNFWCATEATYQTTDDRTASARMVYETGRGRCGEESVFAVNACRSAGLPARQVYAPRWSHCDDNHAWVEVFADGQWWFFGACEPDPRLNRGWFNRAASRAITVHSRWYDDSEICTEAVIGKEGMASIVNQTARYTNTCPIEVTVKNQDGTPAVGAVVKFQVLNYAELANVEQTNTNEEGKALLEAGKGSIYVEAGGEGGYGETIINTKESSGLYQAEVLLGAYPDKNKAAEGVWEEFNMYAPVDCSTPAEKISEEEKAAFDKRLSKAFEHCRNKILNWKHPQQEAYLAVKDQASQWRDMLLKVLSQKDMRDFRSEILETHVQGALEYAEELVKSEGKEFFVKYVMNPRIFSEVLSSFRAPVRELLGEKEEAFRADPMKIWAYIKANIREVPERECGGIYSKPESALKMGAASEISQKILFVAIARTFGIPARLNPESHEMEYWKEGRFVSVVEAAKADCTLTLLAEKDAVWRYDQDWTIAQWTDGQWKTWRLHEKSWEDGKLLLELPSGTYRILTSNRLPNGNIFAGKCQLTIASGENRELHMKNREAQMSDLLSFYQVPDFKVERDGGEVIMASALTGENRMLYIWLEEGMEPTEHILNELIEHAEEFKELQDRIVFLMRTRDGLVDPTLQKCKGFLPDIPVHYHDFGEEAELLARSVYTEPGRWPLIAVVQNMEQGLTALYGTSGYNVGTGDMLLRIMSAQIR